MALSALSNKYNSIVLQVYMLYVHIFLKKNSKVYFVMHAPLYVVKGTI